MANVKITDLAETSQITNSDYVVVDDGSNTKKYRADSLAQASELNNIRAVAEGKTKSYVINARADITGTYDSTNDAYTNVTVITGVTLANLKLGDVILVKAVDVADYWVSQITPSVSLNKMETTKVDLTNIMRVSSWNPTTGELYLTY